MLHNKQKESALVLLVDDDLDILEVCELLLKDNGLHVIPCSSAYQAIQAFHTHQEEINTVVTDFHMPDMDGLELIQNLRMHQPSLKSILISGDFDKELPNNITFLRKPFSFETLIQKIKA